MFIQMQDLPLKSATDNQKVSGYYSFKLMYQKLP